MCRVVSGGSGGEAAGREQVVVRLETSAVHEADVALVRGLLPTSSGSNVGTGGSEGAGTVLQVGAGVHGIAVGDHVLVQALGAGTWTSHGVFHQKHVFSLTRKTSFDSAASLSSVCTASLLLSEFGAKTGDVVVHAGAPGSVGLALAQLASAKKIKLISILRNAPEVVFQKRKKKKKRKNKEKKKKKKKKKTSFELFFFFFFRS